MMYLQYMTFLECFQCESLVLFISYKNPFFLYVDKYINLKSEHKTNP